MSERDRKEEGARQPGRLLFLDDFYYIYIILETIIR